MCGARDRRGHPGGRGPDSYEPGAINDPGTISALRGQVRSHAAAASHNQVSCAAKKLTCDYRVLTTSRTSGTPLTSTKPIGYGADDLATAYATTQSPSTRATITIIDAGAYPKLEADLAVYRAQYGLSPCTRSNGCFTQRNYLGGAPYTSTKKTAYLDEEIAVETALDVDMASAACPKCHITELQVPAIDGTSANEDRATRHFSIGVQTAHKMHSSAVSISYGFDSDKSTDRGTTAKNMRVPGMAILASSGDSGYNGPYASWPQNLTTVISAGGTSLYRSSSTATGYAETAWSGGPGFFGNVGAGSSCAVDLPAAVGQPATIAANCNGHRASSDMSAVSDPYTGVAVYDSYAPATHVPYGWLVVGGTSAASPYLAGLYARAGAQKNTVGPNNVYAAPAFAFTDVTLGSTAFPGSCAADGFNDSLCTAGDGWDGPTGLGSPKGLAPFYSY